MTSVTPANGATGVEVSAPLVFGFDQSMVDVPILLSLPPFLVGNMELAPAASTPLLDGTWSEDGRTLTCTPVEDWPANTTITWKLNPAGSFMPITSESGTPLATVSGSFTTGSGGGSGGDEPALLSSAPANGAFMVPVTAMVTFVFDRPMKRISVFDGAVGWQGNGVDPAKFVYSWSADGLTLTADYTGDLPTTTPVTWFLNPESSTVHLESEAGQPLPTDTYSGGFITGLGGGSDCTPNGIPVTWGSYSLSKGASYQQTSASDPVPAAEIPFSFGASVRGPQSGPAATAGLVVLPNSTMKNLEAAPFGGLLVYNDERASEAALDAAYPPGTYTLRFTRTGEAQRAIPMTMPASPIPVPKIANFPNAQAVNHAQDFTLRWNAFTGAGASDHLSLIVFDAALGKVVFQAPDLCVPRELPVTATSIVLPANTLEKDKTYSATLSFGRMFYSSTTAVPDMAGGGMLSRETHFTIKTGTGGSGTAARFTGYRVLPNGNPEMTLTGTPLGLYPIQRTSSVGTPAWTTIGTVTLNAAGGGVFEDTQAGKTFPLFYRAVAN